MDRFARCMALDVGDARIGVALSDPLGLTAQPQETIERSQVAAVEHILELARSASVGVIVVGRPVTMSGKDSEQTRKVEQFIAELREALSRENLLISIESWDERLTTVEAERHVQGSKLRNRERSARLDQVSAALILDSYLQQQAFPIAR